MNNRRRSAPSPLLLPLLIAGLVLLGACRNPVTPDPDPAPDPVEPPSTTPAVRHTVGKYAISGLERIPTDMIQLTEQEMQDRWAIVDYSYSHITRVSYIGCNSYSVYSKECDIVDNKTPHNKKRKTRNEDGTVTSRAGTGPFTELLDLTDQSDRYDNSWFEQEMRAMGTKIATYTNEMRGAKLGDGTLPWLIINSAGNDGTSMGERAMFTVGINIQQEQKERMLDAIAADKLLYVAGWDRDDNGNYIRHWESTSCNIFNSDDPGNGCVWAPYEYDFGPYRSRGTSYSAPNFSAALASVLAVFPDTSPQNLAAFGKSCAKKSGEGIEELLRVSGGLGVADFNCMGDVIEALANLPTGGSTDLSINGQTVTVGGRDLSLGFTGAGLYKNLLWKVPEESHTVINFIPTSDDTGLLSLTRLNGDLFASTAFGVRDDFFGYGYGHDEVKELSFTAGHRHLFATLSKQKSSGSDFIDAAEGRSVSLTVRRALALTDNTHAVVTAVANKFLGGRARIPVGDIDLNGGGWNTRITVDTTTVLGKNAALAASAAWHSPEHGADGYALRAGLYWRY